MTASNAIAIRDPGDRIQMEIERDPHLKSENTRRGYLTDLNAFNAWRGRRPMSKLLVEQYAAELQRLRKAPNSINRALAAIRWWARRIGDLAAEDRTMDRGRREEVIALTSRVASIEGVDGTRAKKGRHIALGELTALLHACTDDRSGAGVRDAAILAIAWSTGARRSEIVGLRFADLRVTKDRCADLLIRGKGDKVRTVYIHTGTVDAVNDWLELRGRHVRPLFYAIRKGGKILRGHGLSDEALALILEKRRQQALIDDLTWHDFRRTFAGNLLDAGADIATVQQLMGHSSPVTTSGYDRRGDEVRRKAVQALSVPYARRAA